MEQTTIQPFPPNVLATLFARSSFRSFQKAGYLSHFWAPILSVFTGASRDDIFFLTPEHIRQQEGIEYILFLPRYDRQGLPVSGYRTVPLHPLLHQLGFQELIATRRKSAAQERLFSEYRAINQHAGVVFSKHFTRWIEGVLSQLPPEAQGDLAARYRFPSLRAVFFQEVARVGLGAQFDCVVQGIGDNKVLTNKPVVSREILAEALEGIVRLQLERYFPALCSYEELME